MRATSSTKDDYLRVMRRINEKVAQITGNKVATGIFAGMTIPLDSPWEDGNLGTKLCGSYEHELHDAIEHMLRRQPDTIINVGCAEGFYAVGLARLAPNAEMWAFDVDEESIELCAQMARENQVNVRAMRGITSAHGMRVGRGRRLYVVDVEGAELDLLNPPECRSLRSADIIVECHDYLKPGISTTIEERFGGTHGVFSIEPSAPDPAHYPFLASLPFGVLMEAITEKRPPGTIWLVCIAT